MKCTKCGGSGSEGFLTFLRCGRCSATGMEPKDALVPYSEDLIVVPDGPVITALKKDPEAVKKELTEASEKKEKEEEKPEGWAAFGGTSTPLRPRPSRHSPYSYGAAGAAYNQSNQSFDNGPAPEEKKPYIQPISQFFDIPLRHPEHGVAEGLTVNFDFKHLCLDLYSQDVLVHEIGFDSENKYMIKAFHTGRLILEAFYTGLGVKAVMDGGEKIHPYHEIRFELEPQDKNPALLEDRIAVTVWIEKRKENLIHMPNYGARYGTR